MSKKGYIITVLLMLASLIVGIVIGATIFGTIQFSYRISGGTPTMNPSSISIHLGDLVPNYHGIGINETGFTTINTTGLVIMHTLGGDLNVFDEFEVMLMYYKESRYVNVVVLSLDNRIVDNWAPAKGMYELKMQYSYHVKADAPIGTEGTITVTLSY